MALPFLVPGDQKKPGQIIAIDLGSRTTKAVLCEAKGGNFSLSRYALVDAPIYDSTVMSMALLGEHLKELVRRLETRTKAVALAVGTAESLVRQVEMPKMPGDAVRQVLKNNSRNYFQADLSEHVFDYQVTYQAVPEQNRKPDAGPFQRLLVAGARARFVSDLAATGRAAGLNIAHIIPGLVCPVNAFELVHPEDFQNQVVALVEVGFKHSIICVLQQGDLVMNRVIHLGGNHMTSAIAAELNVSYAEAEGIKIGMPNEVHGAIEGIASNLGRELRASIDYFEHQHECQVSRVYLTGGPTRSESVVQFLSSELMLDCSAWNPASFCNLELPVNQASEIDAVSHQLGVALGAAVAAL